MKEEEEKRRRLGQRKKGEKFSIVLAVMRR
jgi:hypothetical protein